MSRRVNHQRGRRPFVHPDTGEGESTLSGWSDVIAETGRQYYARRQPNVGAVEPPDSEVAANPERP